MKVLREQQKIEAIHLQDKLIMRWHDTLNEVSEALDDDEKLSGIAILLEHTSQEMAKERRDKRIEYFERSVTSETELEVAISKVEALLWIDRLIHHYWRATAHMAEFQALDNE